MSAHRPITRKAAPLWTPKQAFVVGVGMTIIVIFAALITSWAIWAD